MRKNFSKWSVVAIALSLSACSSSEKKEGDLPADEVPVVEAGTDAAPIETTEIPAPTGDLPASEAVAQEGEAPAAPPAMSGESTSYTVNGGDTLMKIAFEVYGDLYQWRHIHEMNRDKVQDPNRLTKGLVLMIDKPASPVQIERNGEAYLIKTGDTLGSISNEVYGTPGKWRALWENNRQLIKDPNRIFAGFTLYYAPDPARQNNTAPLANDPAGVDGRTPSSK
ncbi:MAG: LysM peptidoglycan-binding domain-containing protein [Bdellovibrionales bacterium]|nr:LysM peptidoglycan-binding domain-containing protein [Bdellovibrionales bacterium]